jgi:hypothetical protein
MLILWFLQLTKIEKNMLRSLYDQTSHIEKWDEMRLTKEIYETDLGGRGRPRRTFLDQIGEVFEEGYVKSTRKRQVCIRYLMTVEEAKGVCKDGSKWKLTQKGKRA